MNQQKNLMIKFLSLLLATFGLTSCNNEPDYAFFNTCSVKPIIEELDQANKDTLVVFDCDNTLLRFEDAILFQPEGEKFIEEQSASIDRKTLLHLKGIILMAASRCLVNEQLPEILKKSQSRGIKILMITACATGPIGQIESLSDWRNDELRRFGFEFDKSWSEKKAREIGPEVWFDRGIVYAKKGSKGKALGLFLSAFNVHPKKIIFIDDKLEKIQEVKKFCFEQKIDLIGIRYTEAFSNSTPFSKELAMFQLEYLLKHDKWLNDQKAAQMVAAK